MSFVTSLLGDKQTKRCQEKIDA